ncbi:acetylornithine aminotransferase [Branchiibius hedensis]|uniref:Acetylornithine aminotransferase n=1 Tax=Branchiibius hedensis TaxID=672460 RepID=A0A2Y8ZSC9_9MICO|nr:acetylornithine transaminase [Branchiibius hedensis]PWJ25395.1 acetylornithine aminotransferase [Branchiibius hedensis]SSA34208.1 acetylornithine aminotransferase [Branchiibius hedensis]
MTDHLTNSDLLDRYQASVLGVFGRPPLVLSHGSGCYVWDVQGNKYLDLVGGIAVSALGHGHPGLVSAISKQAGEALHVSNLFTSPGQIALAERLLDLTAAPDGSKVFFANSGAEAIEAAIKLSRRTGRTGIVAAEGAFHGRTTGALALTYKAAYREPFEPLIAGVSHVPYGHIEALRAAVTEQTGAVILEPIQGEAGVIAPDAGYLRAAREITTATGALLIVDEIQSGVGRTGRWFGYQHEDIRPDAITLAKGLGGGVPIGAMVTFGSAVSDLLTVGQHGTTFGGNPLAAAAGLAVLETIEEQDLLGNAQRMGDYLAQQVTALGHPLITGVRGAGLLRAITLADPVSAQVAQRARDHGIIINPVAPDALRLVPPLIIATSEIDEFVGLLPTLLEVA